MTAIIIIAIIFFLTFIQSGKKKKTNSITTYLKNNNTLKTEKELKGEFVNDSLRNIKIEVTTSSSDNYSDKSIIDVTGASYQLNPNNLKKYEAGVPFWAHQYVYSYSEINSASNAQKEFYDIFKNSFLRGEYFDLNENTNYAFILLFDLLNEYENHKDIGKLEKQLQYLGQCYPKTKSYGVSFLIRKMEAKGDNEGIARLRSQNRNEYLNSYDNYDFFKLGRKFKTKLNLNDEEVLLLNKLWFPSNNFCNIEFCFLEILKLYKSTVAEMKSRYIQEGTTLDEQFTAVADIIARKHFKYRQGSSNYQYCIETISNEIYSNIFKHCENAVREYYGHKRKINTDTYYTTPEAKTEFETKIVSRITELLPILVLKIDPPDEATEIELYSQNTNRWKIKFEELITNFKVINKEQFIESILTLGELNKKNPSIENIFFEASKFIAKIDKEAALSLYIHYLYHDLKSATFDNKQLTKTIQKSLFKTNDQLHDFGNIVSDLIHDKDLEKALQSVSRLYILKRKKIQIDNASIKEVNKKYSGTVELLNEYLKDEYEDESNSIKTREINNNEVSIEITQKNEKVQNLTYISNIVFTPIQTGTLEIFAKSNLTLSQKELEIFAKSKGVFKNQLIESINDTCYDNLDDVLIEEEEGNYIINENYYQRILAK